jgi:hypothetical protein
MKKMKNIFKFLPIVLLVFIFGCEEVDNFKITESTGLTLVDPGIGTIVIRDNNLDNQALNITWNDSNESGSYDVFLSLDDAFENSTLIGNSDSNSLSLSQGELNTFITNLGGESFTSTKIFIRVSSAAETSNSISFVVVAYETPVLVGPTSGEAYVLTDVNEGQEAFQVNWSFNASDAIETFTYEVEIALSGTDFETIYSLGTVTNTDFASIITSELNETVVTAGIDPETEGLFDLRVKTTFNDTNGYFVEVYTDTVSISVTPYETALPPTLWAVGAGLPDAGWGWDSPEVLPLQGSTYSGNVTLSPDNGGNFRFFLQEDWGPDSWNFPYFSDRGFTIDSNFVNAGDGDSNFQFVGTAGEYFLEIDMDAKTITLGPAIVGPNCAFDQLYLVGAGIATAGWSWDNPTVLPCTGTGTYSGNVELANDTFRFFLQPDWGPDSYNFPYYVNENYTIDPNFEDALDGDNNFRFIGTPGTYLLTVDDVNKTITLGPPAVQCDQPQLWLVGAGIATAGWSWDSPTDFPCVGEGVYSGTVELANDAFRFFLQADWGPDSYNFPYFVNEGYTIDPNFVDAQDGDNNFSFIGTPGSYTLTLDTVNKTITLN